MVHRAIETRYKGRRFRSRLEARYAVLFDALGIEWDYEPEGFELGGGLRYLPDFFLHFDKPSARQGPGAGYWVEIKPTTPTELELTKLVRLANQTHHHAVIICGSPDTARTFCVDFGQTWAREPEDDWKYGSVLLFCTPAGGKFDPRFQTAIRAALSARFEFGENGSRA